MHTSAPLDGIARLDRLAWHPSSVSALIAALVSGELPALLPAAERDPALAASLLACSAAAREAVQLEVVLPQLDVGRLATLVLAELPRTESQPPEPPVATRARSYCVSVARNAREIALRGRFPLPSQAYLAGLLRALGMVRLAVSEPAAYAAVLAKSRSLPELTWQERLAFGIDHVQLSASLAEAWELPDWLTALLHASRIDSPAGPFPPPCASTDDDSSALRAIVAQAAARCFPDGLDSCVLPEAIAQGDGTGMRTMPVANARGETATLWRLAELIVEQQRLEELLGQHRRHLEEEKLAALAEFAAGAGHEINNPLAVICGRAQLLLSDESDPERRRALGIIAGQARRIHEMISGLMFFARPPAPETATVSLASLAAEVVGKFAERALEQETALELRRCDADLQISGDASQLRQMLADLITNALEALRRGGRVEVALERRDVEPEPRDDLQEKVSLPFMGRGRPAPASGALLTVRDDGPGIPAHVRRHLFDPFFSGRDAGRGLGLGLAKCWRIAQNHGGWIDVESRSGQGTTFSVWLPACGREPSQQLAAAG